MKQFVTEPFILLKEGTLSKETLGVSILLESGLREVSYGMLNIDYLKEYILGYLQIM